MAKLAQSAVAAVAASEIVQQYIALSDAFTEMENRLLLVTSSAQELAVVEKQLADISNQNAQSLQASANMYVSLSQSLQGFGVNSAQVMQIMDLLQKTLKLSGTNAQDAAGQIQRFAVALETGQLTARQVTQLLNQIPALAHAIADGLGVLPDKLKAMATAGQLTTQVILNALNEAAPKIDAMWSQTTPTISEAFTVLKNGLTELIGQFDKGAGASDTFASAVKSLGEAFSGASTIIGPFAKVIGQMFSEASAPLKALAAQVQSNSDKFVQLKSFIYRSTPGQEPAAAQPPPPLPIPSETIAATQDYTKAAQALDDALESAQIKQTALNIQLGYGAADQKAGALAAQDYITSAEAQLKVTNQLNAALLAGHPMSLQHSLDLMAEAKALADATNADRDKAQAQADANKVYDASVQMLNASKDALAAATIQQNALAVASAYGVDQQKQGAAAARDYITVANAKLEVDKKIDALAAQHIVVSKATQDAWYAEGQAAAFAKVQTDDASEALASANKSATDFQKVMLEQAASLAESSTAQAALVIEIQQGTAAATAYTDAAKAQLVLEQQIEQIRKAGGTDAEAQINALKQVTAARIAATAATVQMTDAQTVVKNAMTAGETPMEKAAQDAKLLAESFAQLTDEQRAAFSPEQLQAYQKQLQTIQNQGTATFGAQKDALNAFASDFTNFLTDGAFDFKAFADSLIKDIGRIIVQALILKAIKATSYGSSILGAAHGAAFNHGTRGRDGAGWRRVRARHVRPVGGRTGLMGEAGPEAVMPLKRLPGGDLGVKGTAPNIQIVNNTGVSARARIVQSADRTQVIMEAAQLGAQMAEERMTRSMRSGYGPTASALQRTYSLRRRGG